MAPVHAEAIVAMKPPSISSKKKVVSDVLASGPNMAFHPKIMKNGTARSMLHAPPKIAKYLLLAPYNDSPMKPPVSTPQKAEPARMADQLAVGDVADEQAVADFLFVLDRHRIECEAQGKYDDAQMAQMRLKQLQEHEDQSCQLAHTQFWSLQPVVCLHGSNSLRAPSQPLPPRSAGSSTERLRSFMPVPHTVEQSPQASQVPSWQS